MRRQRGFALPGLSPALWLAAGAAVLLVVVWGLWQDRQRLAAERDAWSSAWEAQAAETRRQRLYAQAAEEASQQAQNAARRARASSARHRGELARLVAQEDDDAADPCRPYLTARRCAAVADSLRDHAARVGRAALPGAAGEPHRAGADPRTTAGRVDGAATRAVGRRSD